MSDSGHAMNGTPGPSDAAGAGDASANETIAGTVGDDEVGSIGGPGRDPIDVPEGSRFGRFVVIRRLGIGATGVVYSAYDETLDRRVAVKLLHRATQRSRVRIEREAQALAKLTHPNVVQVYEFGTHEDELFVAMEYVEGETLADWERGEKRDWREVLDAYRQAGQGLAAAHAVRLIHRDFKPQNAVISKDGQVKVLDFGLARQDDREPVEREWAPPSGSASTWSDHQLTADGKLVGTPAYMAPEQYQRADVGVAADQFSFCVALWEGLYGCRPFSAPWPKLLELIARGEPRIPDRAGVPAWVRTIVQRGLAASPEERWPSMLDLVEALERNPAARRRRWLLGAASIAAVGLAGMATEAWWGALAQRCTGGDAALGGAWDEVRQDKAKAAILATEVPYASHAWELAGTKLDAYAQTWLTSFTDACRATSVRGEQSASTMDLRMRCLERAAVNLDAITSQLAAADEQVVRNAHNLVATLPPLSRCSDVEALASGAEPPAPNETATVEGIRVRLAVARASNGAGLLDKAQREVQAASELLATVEYQPVQVEHALMRGQLMSARGEYEAAEAAYTESLELAAKGHQFREMQRAATLLMTVVGTKLMRPEDGLRYAAVAAGLAEGDTRLEAHFAEALGGVRRTQGRYDEAVEQGRRALRLWADALGEGHAAHPRFAVSRNNLANALNDTGDHEAAEAQLRSAVAALVESLGADHPDVAQSRNNLASTLLRSGNFTDAEAELRAALAIRERSLGAGHPLTAGTRVNIGLVMKGRGQIEKAAQEYEAALGLLIDALGDDHPKVTTLRNNIAVLLDELGRDEEAEAMYRKVATAWEASLGPEHPHVGGAYANLGAVLADLGRYEEAELELRRGLGLQRRALGPDHPQIASTEHTLGSMLLKQDRASDALPIVERAWTRRQEPDVPAPRRWSTTFLFARTLWEAASNRKQKDRARELAAQALDGYTAAENPDAESQAKVQAWLDTHRL